jgi:aryl-alcohol dehydrogenase-like predicted oxidoreductase
MKHELGKTGITTSALGMGTWALAGEWTLGGNPAGWGPVDEAESIAAIQAAYDGGIRVFDTAANYGAGLSERLLGKALGAHRRDCVISTKFGFVVHEREKRVEWPGPADGPVEDRVFAECEASLKRLGTDWIDVYFFHQWDYDPVRALELRESLEKLVAQGKIRSYGWSTDDPALAAIFAAGPHCSSIQCTANVFADNGPILELCARAGLSAFNKSPLAMGFLSGKHQVNATFAASDVRSADWVRESFQKPADAKLGALRDILTSGGRSLVQGSLACLWARNPRNLPIPGIRTVQQARENARAMELGPLGPAEMQELGRLLAAPAT